MLRITVKDNMDSQTMIVSQDETIVSMFAKIGHDLGARDVVNLDGYIIPAEEYGRTLEEVGARDGSRLSSVVKMDNA